MTAERLGSIDGFAAAILGESCDPTGGFIRRVAGQMLDESARTVYVAAYTAAYVEECEAERRMA